MFQIVNKKKMQDWEPVQVDEKCSSFVDNGDRVLFVKGMMGDKNAKKKGFFADSRFHADGRPMSVCYRYVMWLFDLPEDQEDRIHSKYSAIEIWKNVNGLLQFVVNKPLNELQSERTFYSANDVTEFEEFFFAEDYDIEQCIRSGVSKSTSLVVLAFYYLKILPPDIRKDVYLNPMFVAAPPYAATTRAANFDDRRRVFHEGLNRFLVNSSVKKMGITYVSYNQGIHAMLLVYDSTHKRLEFYEPNGRNAMFPGETVKEKTIYQYFVRNRAYFLRHHGICKIWGNVF